jgi:hypothetical protein
MQIPGLTEPQGWIVVFSAGVAFAASAAKNVLGMVRAAQDTKKHGSNGNGGTVYGQLGEIRGELGGIRRDLARVSDAVDHIHGTLDAEILGVTTRLTAVEADQRVQCEVRKALERRENPR